MKPGGTVRMPGAATPSVHASELRSVAGRAVAWQSVATILGQVLQAAVTLTAAALTNPKEFALWGIATVVFNAQNLIASLGLGPALVYRREEESARDAVDGAFLVTTVLGVVLGGAIAAAAPAFAGLFTNGFSHGDVADAVRVMSLVFACTTIANVPQALIEKTLDFRRRAMPDLVGSLAYAAMAFALLALGAGIWSLIIAKAAQSALLVILFWGAAPLKPRLRPRFRWAVVRPLIGYGTFFSAAAVLTFLIANFDNIAVARWAGAAALGAYALAYTVTNLVPTFLTSTVGKVFFPLYSAIRDDPATLKRAYQGGLHYVAMVMFPTTAVLAFLAPPVFVSIFGSRWESASPLIRILALYALARAFGSTATILLAASGRPHFMLSVQVLNVLVTLAGLWPAIGFGASGIAGAFTAGQTAAFLLALAGTRRYVDRHLLARLEWPLAATLLGLAAAGIAWGANPFGRWVVACGIFAVVYSVGLLTLDSRARALLHPLLSRVARGSPPAWL